MVLIIVVIFVEKNQFLVKNNFLVRTKHLTNPQSFKEIDVKNAKILGFKTFKSRESPLNFI